MINRELIVTGFIAIEDCELSDTHPNHPHQMQQAISLQREHSTEIAHLFTGLGNEAAVILRLSAHSLNSGDVRVDGHIQLNRGQENSWQEVEGETLFSVFVPKNRALSRTLSIAYEGSKSSFAALLINFRNQPINESPTSSIIVRRSLSTIAVCGIVEATFFRLTELQTLPIPKLPIDSQQSSSIYQGPLFAANDYEATFELNALVLANGQIEVNGMIQQSKFIGSREKILIGQRMFAILVQRNRYMSRTIAFDLKDDKGTYLLLMLSFQNEAA